MYKTATPKPYQCLVVDAVKNRVWKWGACPPELLWEKFTADGGYSARFSDKKSSSDSVDSDGEC
jgi:hypothetical protein